MTTVAVADLDADGKFKAKQRRMTGAHASGMRKLTPKFDLAGGGKLVFVSLDVNGKDVVALTHPFGKVTSMAQAGLVILPSLHVASNSF